MMLTQLADVARRTGYPVVEVPGWKTRTNRDAAGRPMGMAAVRTITCHHTANGGAAGDYPSLRVVRDGRPGLSGPLAHYGIGVSGTIYVIAAGHCNHAGISRSTDFTNSYAIGIEAEARGTGDPADWPAVQRESYERLCAALVDEFPGVGVPDVRGHKETCSPTGRKSDPSFSMAGHRTRVLATNLSTPPKELPEMTPAEWSRLEKMLDEKVQAVRAEFIEVLTKEPLVRNMPLHGEAEGKGFTIVSALSNTEKDVDYLREGVTIATPPAATE